MKKGLKVIAILVCCCTMLDICSCSTVEEFFSNDNSSRYSHKSDKKDKKKKKDKKDNDTEEIDETVTSNQTEPVSTYSNLDLDDLPELTYPDHIYSYNEIHPKHENGTIEGEEASKLLDEIEFDVLNYMIGDSYVDLIICYDDPEAMGFSIPEPKWGNFEFDEEAIAEDAQYIDGILQKLYSINRDTLDDEDQIFYDRLVYDFEENAYYDKFTAFIFYTTALQPLVGPQCDLLFILEVFDFETIEDAENYIALVKDTDEYFDSLCLFEEMRAAYGFASSDDMYEQIAESFDALLEQKDDCFLYDSFEERIDNIDGISEADKNSLIEAHNDAMKNYFFPEFEEVATRIRALKGSNKAGRDLPMCDLPGGDAFFDMYYHSQSNSSASIEDGIKAIDDRIAYKTEALSDTLMNLDYDDWEKCYNEYVDHSYSKGDTKQNLDYLSVAILDDFVELPGIEYHLLDVPEALEENFSPAAYLSYHYDRPEDNLIITNPSKVDSDFGITCAHEGYPGHMYQYNFTVSHCNHPYMYISEPVAYAEGWATYVENYSFKYFTSNENAAMAIQFDNELNILVMARMDIGIHYEGWDIAKCCDYFNTIYEANLNEEDLKFTYDLLISDPCYAVKYGIGYIMTCDIFADTIEQHPDVDIQDIHTAYLYCEPGTFEQIRDRIDSFIDD